MLPDKRNVNEGINTKLSDINEVYRMVLGVYWGGFLYICG